MNTSGALSPAFTDSFLYRYLFSSSIYVGSWTMIAGFVIVPVVSLFRKKSAGDVKRLDALFRPFESLSEAVEQAADPYLEGAAGGGVPAKDAFSRAGDGAAADAEPGSGNRESGRS